MRAHGWGTVQDGDFLVAAPSYAGLGAAQNRALSHAGSLWTVPGTRTAPPELQPHAEGALFSP